MFMKTTFVCLFRAVYIYISDQKTKTIMNTSYFLQSREKSKALLFDSCKIFSISTAAVFSAPITAGTFLGRHGGA